MNSFSLKREIGKDFTPGITLQADIPINNMVAMNDEARRLEFLSFII